MKKIIGKTLIGIMAAIIILLPAVALAVADDIVPFSPQVGIPGEDSDFQAGKSIDTGSYYTENGTKYFRSDLLAKYLQDFYSYGQGIVGIVAVIILMAGGVIWLTSGGDSGKIGQAKKMIAGAIVGIVVLFSSWIILNTINPDLVNLGGLSMKATIGEKNPDDNSNNSCCQYLNATAKNNITAKECNEAGGTHYTNSEALDGAACVNKVGETSVATKPNPDAVSAYKSCCQYPDMRVKENIRQSVCTEGGGSYYSNSKAHYSDEAKTKGACVTDIK